MKVEFHDFYCTKCGNKGLSLPRKIGQLREPGHLKKMYCVHCQDEHNFAELSVRYKKEDFMYEFKTGNFIDGNRQKTLKEIQREMGEE